MVLKILKFKFQIPIVKIGVWDFIFVYLYNYVLFCLKEERGISASNFVSNSQSLSSYLRGLLRQFTIVRVLVRNDKMYIFVGILFLIIDSRAEKINETWNLGF